MVNSCFSGELLNKKLIHSGVACLIIIIIIFSVSCLNLKESLECVCDSFSQVAWRIEEDIQFQELDLVGSFCRLSKTTII